MNYFYIGSMVGVAGMSAWSIIRTYLRSQFISCMAGMMIAMTIGMMTSVTVGTIAGVMYPKDLTFPTAASVLLGLVCGYLAGKPISTMAALDGMLAGIMGGMMGAMLGVMMGTHAVMMVLFVDVLYLFVHLVVLQLIREESQEVNIEAQESSKQTPLLHPLVFGLGIFVLAAVFLYQG
ncbi:hypothetical protein [Paenibacillus sp. CF384]|uniref:hypothetical protein n=1 Tax=Paenibacillus sp. CF384 TaxID=1884382 RepID=UPI0008950ECB|nr:hypothetical protein [Paenibacillus sp. CF384]SDX52066.1 hypothetical protein SAMN05518855_1015165 [Paenibacillus sp. CF384]